MRSANPLFLVFTIFVIVLLSNLLSALTVTIMYGHVVVLSSYRPGYVVLLVALPSLILLLFDLLAYTAIHVHLGMRASGDKLIDPQRLARGMLYASLPVLALLVPELIVGICGVAAPRACLEPVAFMVYVWDALVGLYSLYIHPVYAPYAGLVTAHWALRGGQGDSFWELMRERLALLPWVLLATILSSLTSVLLVRLTTSFLPSMQNYLVSLPGPHGTSGWAWKWFVAASAAMPRYSTLLADGLRYLLYAVIAYELIVARNRGMRREAARQD